MHLLFRQLLNTLILMGSVGMVLGCQSLKDSLKSSNGRKSSVATKHAQQNLKKSKYSRSPAGEVSSQAHSSVASSSPSSSSSASQSKVSKNSKYSMEAANKRFPRIQEPENPPSVFKEHNELAKTLPLSSTRLQGPVELTDKEKIFFELSGEKIENISEINVYRKAVEKYQQNDEVALNAYVSLLTKKFPRSIYCDNALYLQGMLYFSQKKFGESLVSFQRILNLYPQSNKAVSALFAKGIVFKKMNLNKQALRILAQVMNNYPGSPESARAEIESKLVTQ